MAKLKTVRINPKTGEVEYFFPMELTPETWKDYKDLIKLNHYQTGRVRLGYREFWAVLIPVTEEQYHDLISDELHEQNETRQAGRCIVSNGKGGYKLCPRQIPNPAYVEGGSAPKTIKVQCGDCPRLQSYKLRPGRTVSFTDLGFVDEDGEVLEYEPFSPEGYLTGNRYEELCREFVAYVRTMKPGYEPIAELLAEGYSQVEMGKKLSKSTSTIHDHVKILRDLLTEFLRNVDGLT